MEQAFERIPAAYELVSQEYIDEVKSEAAMLRHKKTGACIAVLSNHDRNKVFNIIFRTPPINSTGVAHITEHSVLCGSRKFPVKDPFVELVKGSLNTFLNAMTYPDKTMYPVASCNDKDFQNLMHVYLDSVFYPNIYIHKEIFQQEGWHYELYERDGELTYNGVVYNEMKGAFSSADQVLSRKITSVLYPDTTYGQESGGEPEHIPDLTYEEFLDFHRRYYHPSNSFIYLYGDMDVYEKLDFIDREYLSAFDALQIDSEVGLQQPFSKVREETFEYSISSEEDPQDHTYLSYTVVLGESRDPMLYIAFSVLDYALMSCPGAPLKKALIDSGIGKDAYSEYERSIRQPYFSIVLKDSNESERDRFVEIIRSTLRDLVEHGLNPDSLRAALNSMEFKFREADYGYAPSGLMYSALMMDSWLYDKDQPFSHLRCFQTFDALREQIGTGYFEDLIRTYFLENTHAVVLVLRPKQGLATLQEEELARKLAEKKAALSMEQIDALIADTAHLKAYQDEPSSQEELKSIPMLELSDIGTQIVPLNFQEREIGGFRGIFHDIETRGIGYLRLLFDLRKLPAHLIPYAGLLSSVLGNIDTQTHAYQDLNNEISMYTGGIYTSVVIFGGRKNGEYYPCFEVSGRALFGQMEKMGSLMRELMFTSKLDDGKRIREIIAENVSRQQMSFYSAGHTAAVNRASTYFSEASAYKDKVYGMDQFRFLQDLEEHFEEKEEEILSSLQETVGLIFSPAHLLVDFTGKEEHLGSAKKALTGLESCMAALAPAPVAEEPFVYKPERKNEGFITPGMVQYDACAGNFVKAGYTFHGALNVLKVILEYEYLWIALRVKGGAYGCMCGFSRNGNTYLVSYRDPHLKETYEVYQGCAQYLRNFEASDRDMLKYIIGAVSAADAPMSPNMEGSRSLGAYFSGLTDEELQKSRYEMLHADVETIRGFAGLVEAVVSQNQICVVGSESSIREQEDFFGSVLNL